MAATIENLRGATTALASYVGKMGQLVCNTEDASVHYMDGVQSAGYIIGGAPVNIEGGTTYTVAIADQGRFIVFTSASAVAVTVPQAGAARNFQQGAKFWVMAFGAGTVTLTPTISTINGASSLVLPAGTAALVVSDGTNYYAIKTISAAGGGTVTSVIAGTGLSGGTITTSGTISMPTTGVSAGSYTNTNLTVDAEGRITSASNGSAASPIFSSKTTTYNVLSGDTLTYFDNIGASGTVTFNLPAAARGLQYRFACYAAHNVVLQTNGSDQIAVGTVNGSAGGTLTATTPFSFIEITAFGSGQWVVTSMQGSWS